MEDLTKAIIGKSDNKAVELDGIPFEIYKCLEKVNLSWILNLFNEWWKGGVVQDYFKEGKISLLPKLLNSVEAADFRPITLLNSIWKIYTGLVNGRLDKFWNKFHFAQIGWRKGTWIQENIKIVKNWLRNNLSVYFVDFRKAFDSVLHSWLLFLARSVGGEKLKIIIRNILGGESSFYGSEDKFSIEVGVRQGDPISPFLFCLAIDSFIRIIYANLKRAGNDYEGAETGYADDLSICIREYEEWKIVLENLVLLSKYTGITRNEGKCVFLDAGNIGCPDGVIRKEKVKYLGAEMNIDGSLDWNELLERTGRRLSIMKPLVSMYKIRAQVEFLNIFVISMWTYLLRVYKVKDEILARFRRLISTFFKGRISAIRLEGDWKSNGYGLKNIQEFGCCLRAGWKIKWCMRSGSPAFLKFIRKLIGKKKIWPVTKDGKQFKSNKGKLKALDKFKPCKIYRSDMAPLTEGQEWRWKDNWKEIYEAANKGNKGCLLWWRDNIQHILKVAYHEEVCALCGEVINGDHFRGRCGFSRRLMKDSIRIDLENIKWFWATWFCHVATKHTKPRKWLKEKLGKAVNRDDVRTIMVAFEGDWVSWPELIVLDRDSDEQRRMEWKIWKTEEKKKKAEENAIERKRISEEKKKAKKLERDSQREFKRLGKIYGFN